MKLFDPEGPLMGALGKLADLAVCNVLFIVCSLPLFTLGAALTALYACTMRIARDTEPANIARLFLAEFRRRFKRATALWGICLAVCALLYLYRLAAGTLGGALGSVYTVTCLALALLAACGLLYVFPLQARFDLSVPQTVKSAFLLSAAALPCTLGVLAVSGMSVYLTFFMDPNAFSVAVYLWIVLLFAVVAYLNSFLFLRAFRRLGAQDASEQSE